MLSFFRRITTQHITKGTRSCSNKHNHNKYNIYTTRIYQKNNGCSIPYPLQLQKSFTSNSPNGNHINNSPIKQQLIFITLLYIPFFAMISGGIFFRDEILTYFMRQIFKRRESFLIKCYPKRIILIRHGQSEANIDQNKLADIPDHDIKLTHLGYSEALEAGRKLKTIVGEADLYAYYSPYQRAQETLYAILEGGNLHKQTKVQIEDVRLIEQKFGNHQTVEQMKREKRWRLQYGRYFYQFKYGESGLDVTLRATAFTDRLFDHFRTGYYSTRPDREWNVLVVSHGLFMRVFLKTFLRRTVSDFQKWYNYANCEMCILCKGNDGEYTVSCDTPLPLTPRKRIALND